MKLIQVGMEEEQSRGLTRPSGSIACCHIRAHTALVMVSGDLRDVRENGFFAEFTLPFFFFASAGGKRHSRIVQR